MKVFEDLKKGIAPPEPKKRGRPKSIESGYKYAWIKTKTGFVLSISNDIEFEIINPVTPVDNYEIRAIIKGKTFKGKRPILEYAFKALDELFYKHYKDLWVNTDCCVVLREFEGNLNI